MKRLLLIISILFAAYTTNAQVNITLLNKTGRDLSAVKLDKGKYIGEIEKDSTKAITLAVVEFFEGVPQLNMSLQYEGKTIATNYESVGLTYLTRVMGGDYTLAIFIQPDSWGTDHLYISLARREGRYCGNSYVRSGK
jgi:hypothetical protein